MSGRRLTRRGLLGAGTGAAGAAALGGLPGLAGRALAAEGEREERPNVVLVMLDRVRADYVKCYDDVFDDRPADTPNLDALSDDALRFKYVVPDSMPAIPARRALLTGMRAYPFRDWVATAGVPPVPGWGKILDHQPLLPELTAAAGVETVVVSDNPLLSGSRFPFLRRTRELPRSTSYTADERSYLLPVVGGARPERREPTAPAVQAGIDALGELKGSQPFFLTIDAFNPVDAFEMPRQHIRWNGPLNDDVALPVDHRYVDQAKVRVEDGAIEAVRERYAAEVTAVDRSIGRLLNAIDDAGLTDNTAVLVIGDSGIALGEQGVFDNPVGVWHRRVYQVPFMIRDPRGRWAGDTSSWFVATHDVAPTILSYLGITIPGKMAGEDLTTLFDDDDLPSRPYFTTAIDSHVVVGDRNWLLLGRSDQDRWRVFEAEDEDEPDEIRSETVKSPTVLEGMKRYAIAMAGGTLPEFDADSALRPQPAADKNKRVADDGTLDEDEQEANELR